MPDELLIHGVDALEMFMNHAGIASEKALLEKGLSEHLKERK